ncbi:MAG: transposase [bacterium (Candidatus Ratteibacteria) CG15_BIG_FIL_POST_REV_8_21_14_020_41_12]|uniref:Transposase n=1 Tax=bacterium (Candidatus Ratteibacteria) CG15_BIG_FIL_POST_REV_8_21_14_020_41_12 TaxID=2014291 RepID=A0A2M7H0C7_9BACT|nr:MAG: transposase [bacterium (Candidatus Ratteibacteria) CG15_BIG_FIL_POST_REV_8_21_14_020_41_12]
MARRKMAVRDFVEIYEQWQGGLGKKTIARSLGISKRTVRKYIEIAEEAGITRSGPKLSRADWVNLVHKKIDPHQIVKEDGSLTTSEVIRPYHNLISEGLKETTGKTIWDRLQRERELNVSYSSFKRYLRKYFWQEMMMNKVRILRKEPPAGEEAQIDFGRLGYWFDPAFGKKRLLYAFAMALAFSRYIFIWIVGQMDLKNWIDAHIKAFEFFDGVPARWVTDNLKDSVIKPDLYDPKLNRTYDELARHYGAIIDPCRGGKPRDKARVERPIPYIRDSFFSGRGDSWRSLDEIREAAMEWCIHVAGQRVHGTTREVPIEVFRQIEQGSLKPLPEAPFEMSQWYTPIVHPDSHILVAGALYSVPWKYIGSEVDARVTAKTVEIYKDEQIIKTHIPVPKGKRQTDYNDYPPEKVQFYQRDPQWCLAQAQELGPSVYQVVEELLRTKAFNYLRQCQGIIRMGEKYGDKRLEAACYRAIIFDIPSYRTIKNILKAEYDRVPPEGNVQLPLPIGGYLHGAEEIVAPYGEEV